MANKATVRIYGSEYTIMGDKPVEEIQKIGEYVDGKMQLISKVAGDNLAGNIGILSAINIAEEYFDALSETEDLKLAKAQLEKDAKYYQQMWEDAKKSFRQHKDDIDNMRDRQASREEEVKKLEERCAEYESTFFDLKTENIRLKSELEKLKK